MANFTLRKYREETDFDPIYNSICEICEKTVSYYVTGCSSHPHPDQIRKIIDKPNHSTVVTDANDLLIGIAYHYYWDRPGKFYKIHVQLWEKPELATMVLHQKMAELFSNGRAKMVVCKVPGFDQTLLDACRMNNMEQVGCIPDYCCYDGELFPEYIMIMKYDNWLNLNPSPSM